MAQVVPAATTTAEISSNETSSCSISAEVHSAARSFHREDPNTGLHDCANSVTDATSRGISTTDDEAYSFQDENLAGPSHGLLTEEEVKTQPDFSSQFFGSLSSMYHAMWSTSWLQIVVVSFGLASLTALMILLSSSVETNLSFQAEEEDPGLVIEMSPTVAVLRSRGVEPFNYTLDRLDRQRCGGMWQQNYSQLHSSMVRELAARRLESQSSHELFSLFRSSNPKSKRSPSSSSEISSEQTCRGQRCRAAVKVVWHGVLPGLADSLFGLMSLLLYAMVTRRALFVQNKCLNLAFEPVGFDWRLQTGEALEVAGSNVPFDIARMSIRSHDTFAEVRDKLKTVENSTILRVSSNRGFLVETLGKRGIPGLPGGLDKFNARPENSFGCFMHYMMRPRPEIQEMVSDELEEMQISKQRHLICMHARLDDNSFATKKDPRKKDRRMKDKLVEIVRQMVECAKRIEAQIRSDKHDKFFFASSSKDLKKLAQQRYKGKVVISRIEPSHLKFPKGGEEWERRSCQQTVTEWSILSRCTHIILIHLNSGFAKSAAFYGFHESKMYEGTSCKPPRPWSINTLSFSKSHV